MKRRILALMLALALTAALCVPALAAVDSTANFVPVRTYSGQFSDLSSASAHYEHVKALYEYGLSQGKGDGRYGMDEPMQVGEILIFAARIRSLYRTGDPEAGAQAHAGEGSGTWGPYLAYLQAEGVVGDELTAACGSAATRAQVAHVLANTLPTSALSPINDAVVTEGYALGLYITDVTEYTPYQRDILQLYRLGLSQGSDAKGSFRPSTPITRAEAASMLTRMVDKDLRLTLHWDLSGFVSAQGTTLGDLVEPGTLVTAPATDAEMDSSIRYMLSRNEHVLNLRYSGLTAAKANAVMNQALAIVKDYCEQMYNSVSCTYDLKKGTMRLTFGCSGATATELAAYRQEAMETAIAVHDQLWQSGTLHAGMTQKEIARVYFAWICRNCVYDDGADPYSLSHIAYSLFHSGTAVCDGYTGAYNLLLKLEGISCWTQSNTNHIWTVAELDGTVYHIDTTWGDSSSTVQYQYFAMTPAQSWSVHRW